MNLISNSFCVSLNQHFFVKMAPTVYLALEVDYLLMLKALVMRHSFKVHGMCIKERGWVGYDCKREENQEL